MAVNKGMKILIVDDARTMLQIIKGQFLQLGFNNLDLATDGQMALGKIKEGKFDLVISDWNMEPMNGIELLRAIRADPDPKINTMPVILITAESKVENVIEAKKAGVNNYIIKPFTPTTLKEKLAAVIGEF